MVSQATMNGRPTSGAKQVTRNVTELAHDVITLAELQAQLFGCDLREGKSHAVVPIVLMVTGLLLALGSMPVLLMGLAWLLVSQVGWSESAALLASGALALLVAGGLTWFGWNRLQAAIGIVTRSRDEFVQNVHWLKCALTRSSGR